MAMKLELDKEGFQKLMAVQADRSNNSFLLHQSFIESAIKSEKLICDGLISKKDNYYIQVQAVFPAELSNKEELTKIAIAPLFSCFNDFYDKNIRRIFLPFYKKQKDSLYCKVEIFLSGNVSLEEVKSVFETNIQDYPNYQIININKINLESLSGGEIPPPDEVSLSTSWKGLTFNERLLTDTNYLMNESPYKRYYGIESQIRLILSSLKSAIDSNGKRMTHSVLFGPPACGKTSVLNTLEEIVGKHNVLKLDAPATTKAGIEKLFLNSNIPPIVILEEAEKANEDWLRSWLSLLDERSEIRKVNHKETIVKDIDILFYCTVNDSEKFNDLLDGALASRCKNKIYFPRPSEETVRKILCRDVLENGGKMEWVEPAMVLAKELNIDDPRVIISFLSGGDRLLDGSYQKDKKNCLENNIL